MSQRPTRGGSDLILAGAASATALDLPPDLDFDAWQETGRTLGRIGRACQWWIGDWLNYGEKRYGEKYAQAMEDTELEYQSLADCAYVAARIKVSRRRETLSWSHHREVAALDPAVGDRLLDRAEAEKLTREQLRRERRRPTPTPTPDLPPGQYSVLYVDPPWRYEGIATPELRAIENQYPTMTLDELRALKLPAATDAVLFMWATSPKLTEALELMSAWAFEYRTCAAWVKDRIGMGYYFRQQHELLLVGRRGDPPLPEESNRPPSIVTAPRGRHSEKPERFYELLEAMYPHGPRIELFARSTRKGWDSWGNEVERAA